jgi:hypothetical protein
MQKSGEWFMAQAVNAVRHRIASALAIKTAKAAAKSIIAATTGEYDRDAMTLSVPITAEGWITIVDNAGCTARVVRGQVWMTTEGFHDDTIAEQGQKLVFKRGGRALLTAFRDAVIVIAAPKRKDLRFALDRTGRNSVVTIGIRTVAQPFRWLAVRVVRFTRKIVGAYVATWSSPSVRYY